MSNTNVMTVQKKNKSIKEFFKVMWNDLVYSFRDLKKQKVRTFFGVAGIAVSILLMQVVGVLTDSLSFSYLDSAATNAGAADMIITSNLDFSGSINPYMNQTYVQDVLDDIEEIKSVFPRLLLFAIADIKDPGPNEASNKSISLYGLNVSGEDENGLGFFTYAENETRFTKDVPDGYCIITPFIQEALHVSVGDNITIKYATFPVVNLTVMAIVEQAQKFMIIEIDTIITNLPYLQEQYDLNGRVNYFEALLNKREEIYDTRNIPNTIDRMRRIGEKVQDTLGYDYTVSMLKLQDLENSETMNVAMSVAFIFISIISGIIAAILINSILTTAVEERIRDFGVFRVLGAKRSFLFKIILQQGFFLSIIGSAIGVFLGTWFAQTILPILYNWLDMWTNPIPLIVQPTTVITSITIGIGITLFVTAMPAYKAAMTKIVHAINPYRHQRTGWKIKKEGKVNGKLISGGLAAVAAGSIVFYLIPQIALTGDIFVVMIAFLGVMMAFLIGLTFVSLGFVPGIQKLIWHIFRMFNKKTTPIVKTSLYRYRRRNTSTVLMFSMTFAFIMFISTMTELMKVQQEYLINYEFGAPLVVYSTDVTNQVDENLMDEISKMPGVVQTSGIYTDSIDMAAVRLYLSQKGLQDINTSRAFDVTRYEAYLSDLINYYSFSCSLVGVDENYSSLVDENLMRLRGGSKTIEKLFDEDENNVIIAKSMADQAQLSIGDNVRLTFYNTSTGSYHRVRIINATIVGISDGMPGFWQFRKARFTAFIGGVMISKEHYLKWMNMNTTESAPLSKILIKTNSNNEEDLKYLRDRIDNDYNDRPRDGGRPYDFIAEYAQSEISRVLKSLSTVELLLTTILIFTILIALFGLMSSVYSTVIERKREIGILKAIGLKNKQTSNLFLMESIIILLSSSIAGTIIGITSSVINAYENTTISEIPIAVITNINNLPWPTIIISFTFAITVCILGMIFLLRRIKKMDIMEIFRQTL
ncbi:MAG: ABC transporter permease [Promethearchaeota archaeon]